MSEMGVTEEKPTEVEISEDSESTERPADAD